MVRLVIAVRDYRERTEVSIDIDIEIAIEIEIVFAVLCPLIVARGLLECGNNVE